MKQLHYTIAIVTMLIVMSQWASPTLSDPPIPRIDWQELEELLGDDPDNSVGEEMC